MAASKMNNPLRILKTLDGFLTEDTELIIFGKAAIVLGFPSAPEDYGSTLDVDGILPLSELEAISKNEQFWEAIEKTNGTLEPDGLYITHLFEETQTILTPNWLEKTVDVNLDGMRHLKIKRPSTVDLILTKMTRGCDPQDLSDISFLIAAENTSSAQLQEAMDAARVPDLEEIRELFESAKQAVLKLAKNNQERSDQSPSISLVADPNLAADTNIEKKRTEDKKRAK